MALNLDIRFQFQTIFTFSFKGYKAEFLKRSRLLLLGTQAPSLAFCHRQHQHHTITYIDCIFCILKTNCISQINVHLIKPFY